MRALPLACCVAALPLHASDKPAWSEVEGNGANASSRTDYHVEVLGMNGQMDFDRERSLKRITPGMHYLQIATTKPGKRGRVSYQTVTLDAEACVRYYLAARHKLALDNLEWDPVIVREKRIGGCGEKQESPVAAPAIEAG